MFITIIAAAMLSSTPAPPPTGAPAPQPSATASTARAKYNPRVCIVDQITGSRIPARSCKLLGQWRTDGIDPLPKR